jgi:cholesterol oxidase
MSDTHVDAVVIGSGFGGSVMTYRLAEAGLQVCLLERGQSYPPGSFARTPSEMRHNFWDPSERHYGLFNLWSFRGIAALISSGLGGGSLIYANVLLRKDERWFVNDLDRGGYEEWPVTRADLDPHYDRVEKMMAVQPYPLQHEPYARTPKTRGLQAAAEELKTWRRYRKDLTWDLPPLAVTFGPPGEDPYPGLPIREEHPNLHGLPRDTCRLCGECNIGCNFGSKNTLDYTYLSAALRQQPPPDIRTLCEVRTFAPRPGGGYVVRYVQHVAPEGRAALHRAQADAEAASGASAREEQITCNQLILSAGALGTPYLLLRNQESFPALSRQLGTRFSGNGDLLTFTVRAHEQRDGRRVPRPLEPSYGPVITSALRVRDKADGGKARGYYVEDAGYPNFASWLVQVTDAPGALRRWTRLGYRYLQSLAGIDPDTDLGTEFAAAFGPTTLSGSSLPLLGMGRDIPNGRLRLRGKYLDLDWRISASRRYFKHMRRTMKDVARALDGDFRDNVMWYLGRVVTVHPLGGCPMGHSPETGVVDAHGEVFGHPGLYVADGSIMPGPVGPNPALTIAGLADRAAERVIANRHRR